MPKPDTQTKLRKKLQGVLWRSFNNKRNTLNKDNIEYRFRAGRFLGKVYFAIMAEGHFVVLRPSFAWTSKYYSVADLDGVVYLIPRDTKKFPVLDPKNPNSGLILDWFPEWLSKEPILKEEGGKIESASCSDVR